MDLGNDLLAFDAMDEMLDAVEPILGEIISLLSNAEMIKDLVVGGRVHHSDSEAVATGLVAITVYGTPEETGKHPSRGLCAPH